MADTPERPTSGQGPEDQKPNWPFGMEGQMIGGGGYIPPTPQPRPVEGAGSGLPPEARVPVAPAVPTVSTDKAAGSAGAKSEKPAEPDHSAANIIDTIEAIIIALIIALTFRAFIVEAFVIPTGSMAPTLLGAHYKVICPKCGYRFDRETDLRDQLSGEQLVQYTHGELMTNHGVPFKDRMIHCPNCDFGIDPTVLPQYLGKRSYRIPGGPLVESPFVWANNGDRILVLKYYYALFEPHRWDVIVFKEPMAAKDNYIKRLIGLPGETVQIVNGDVFIGAPGTSTEKEREIARKPGYVQNGLWQVVYDNDYYPSDEGKGRTDFFRAAAPAWHNPWVAGGETAKGWTLGGPVFRYETPGAGKVDFTIRARKVVQDSEDPYGYNLLGYNDDLHDKSQGTTGPLERVADLRVETTWTPADAASATISLTAGQSWEPSMPTKAGEASRWNQYRVTWSSAGVRLEQRVSATNFVEILTIHAPVAPEAGHSYHVAFENVDHAQRLYVDGRLLLENLTPWNAQQAVEEANVIPLEDTLHGALVPASVEVAGPCTLGHLKLSRDLYYTQVLLSPGGSGVPKSHFDSLSSKKGTATMTNPLTLGPDEFFAMGDNSRKSHDGRSWAVVYGALDDIGTRPGVVPRRYLLGKAFFVYWPAGYSPLMKVDVPFLPDLPLIPNVGDMRMIR